MSSTGRDRVRLRAIALVLFFMGPLLAAEVQSAGNVPTVGYLLIGSSECKVTARDEAFYGGLRDLGYVPGQTITVDRKCFGTDDEMRNVLSGFVDRKIDVIFVGAPALAIAARTATREIPIVCGSCGDPLENGLVASLARPGGNVTGLASQSAELIGKRVELLKEAVPKASRVAALLNPENPGTRPTLKALDSAGRALGIEIQRVEFRNVGDFDKAFRLAATGGATAVLVQEDPHALAARIQIAQFALRHRLPTIAGVPEAAEAGTLIAYGPSRTALYRRAATFVDKILKGAKPGDLPIEQPTKYDLIINLKTAKAIGFGDAAVVDATGGPGHSVTRELEAGLLSVRRTPRLHRPSGEDVVRPAILTYSPRRPSRPWRSRRRRSPGSASSS